MNIVSKPIISIILFLRKNIVPVLKREQYLSRITTEIYTAAGIEFNFSPEYVKELAEFVKGEYDKL